LGDDQPILQLALQEGRLMGIPMLTDFTAMAVFGKTVMPCKVENARCPYQTAKVTR